MKIIKKLFLVSFVFFLVGCFEEQKKDQKIILENEINMYLDEEYQVIPEVVGIKNPVLNYYSENEEIFIIVDENIILPISAGVANIVIEVEDTNLVTKAKVVITEKLEGSITVTGRAEVKSGENIFLKSELKDITGETVWESLNEDIATIDEGGLVLGGMPGIATIKASVKDSPYIYTLYKINVLPFEYYLKMSKDGEIILGDRSTYSIIARTYGGSVISSTDCEFRSLNESVATVNELGELEIFSVGEVSIEVTYRYTKEVITINVIEPREINYRNLIVEAAMSELYYREGPDNYTKFGVWYGMPNAQWCAIFVSWAANEVGMMGSIVPRYALVSYGLDYYKKLGPNFYKSYEETQRGEYVPIAGDIIFFTSNGASHTGIVIKVVGNTLYTIEGNTSDQVLIRSYNYKNHNTITGYGVPNYPPSSTPIKDFDISGASGGKGQPTT